MNHGSCGTATLVNLLSILFLLFFFTGVDAKGHHDESTATPPECPGPDTAWWKSLRGLDNADPCEMYQTLKSSVEIAIDCCFDGPDDHDDPGSRDKPPSVCGPCNVQTFNVAAACQACAVNTTTPPEQGAITANGLPPFSTWNASNVNPNPVSLNSFNLPPWTNVNVTGDTFDIQLAVQQASGAASTSPSSGALSLSSSASSEPSIPPTSTVASGPTASATPAGGDKSPANSSTSPSISASQKSGVHAGAIAGGVIGGIVLLPLLAFAIFYFVRRRRRRHIAPSAEFLPVSSPYTRQTGTDSEIDYEAAWRGPTLEKVHTSDTSINGPTWSRDIAKY